MDRDMVVRCIILFIRHLVADKRHLWIIISASMIMKSVFFGWNKLLLTVRELTKMLVSDFTTPTTNPIKSV
jgi:hypothetical protein